MATKDYPHEVETRLDRIRGDGSIADENKELIQRFVRDQRLNEQSPATVTKNLSRLRPMAQWAGDSSFADMEQDDLKDMVAWIQNGAHSGEDYSDATIFTYKTVIRAFWNWMKDGSADDPPEEIAWITINYDYGNDTLPEDLLTPEDIERQIKAANNPRDRAFIATLYETGARIGELIDLEVGAIEDRKHGKKVVISGKTGARRLPLLDCVPHLNRWLSEHPNPLKDAPLWCKLRGTPEEPLSWNYLREKVLRASMEAAGLDKPSNPHHYRHSRATELAQEMTEAQLCEWFGWVQGSDQPAKYVHLSGRDLDGIYDEMHGLVDPAEEEDGPNVIQCWRCEEIESPDRRFCGRCGAPLDKEASEDLETAEAQVNQSRYETEPEDTDTQEAIEGFEEALKEDPEFRELVAEKLAGG